MEWVPMSCGGVDGGGGDGLEVDIDEDGVDGRVLICSLV